MEVRTAVVDDDVATLTRLHANSVPLDKKDEDERTPLHWASAHGRTDVVEFLLQTVKARVNVQDDAGWTPLMSAASAGHVDVVSLLLSHGANANLANENGQIPLHYHRGRLEIAELLVDCTTNINCTDDVGSTPLTRAIGGKPSREIIALFLDHGARLTTRDIGGNTPLHIALAEGHEDIARFLIEAGANVNAKNKENERCVDLMTSAFRKEIASALPGKFEASNP
uniref:Uncharacterized protein n=1 Tax=Globisporangium ultimum (strain ATCC 200006 / CBS 805.95 / DAOM BR144) TaxID=431595 RepID=K3WQF8_GLOUD